MDISSGLSSSSPSRNELGVVTQTGARAIASGRRFGYLEHGGPLLAAGLVLTGFFLPWIHGAGVFSLRSFSGFDLARLVRHYEIAVDSPTFPRAIALALYFAPACALNAALVSVVAGRLGLSRRLRALTLMGSGGYACLIVGTVLVASLGAVGQAQRALSQPEPGLALAAAGSLALVYFGFRQLRLAT